MELILDKDLAKAWGFVEKLLPGEIFEVKNIPEARRHLFIRCIKQRIDTLNDCEFNSDYTRLRKIQTIADLQKLINNV
jgi:hypothetical protein